MDLRQLFFAHLSLEIDKSWSGVVSHIELFTTSANIAQKIIEVA